MAGWTNRGKKNCLSLFTGEGYSAPTTFYLALVKSTPTAATNVLGDLTEITAGNGYAAGGVAVARNNTIWTSVEDDGADEGYVSAINITFTNTGGGTIPSDAAGATHGVLTDDNGTLASREVFAYGSFGGAKVSGTDQDFIVQGMRLTLTE
jgi:hypothetical protein